jgi:hypothetical protein
MVAEICLGQVGAVAAPGVSRFARNSRDGNGCRVCRVVDTLLIDQKRCTRHAGNDRLLFGLKGSLNSTNWICCDNVRWARREKARRGDSLWRSGTHQNPGSAVGKDPDRHSGGRATGVQSSWNSVPRVRSCCGILNMAWSTGGQPAGDPLDYVPHSTVHQI